MTLAQWRWSEVPEIPQCFFLLRAATASRYVGEVVATQTNALRVQAQEKNAPPLLNFGV